MRRAALLGIIALAVVLPGCSADSDTDGAQAPVPEVTSDTVPPLAQIDLDAWGASVFDVDDNSVKTEAIEPGHAETADITQESGDWSLEVACLSHDPATVTITVTAGYEPTLEQLVCTTDPAVTPEITRIPYAGGADVSAKLEASAEAGFAVQTVPAS